MNEEVALSGEARLYGHALVKTAMALGRDASEMSLVELAYLLPEWAAEAAGKTPPAHKGTTPALSDPALQLEDGASYPVSEVVRDGASLCTQIDLHELVPEVPAGSYDVTFEAVSRMGSFGDSAWYEVACCIQDREGAEASLFTEHVDWMEQDAIAAFGKMARAIHEEPVAHIGRLSSYATDLLRLNAALVDGHRFAELPESGYFGCIEVELDRGASSSVTCQIYYDSSRREEYDQDWSAVKEYVERKWPTAPWVLNGLDNPWPGDEQAADAAYGWPFDNARVEEMMTAPEWKSVVKPGCMDDVKAVLWKYSASARKDNDERVSMAQNILIASPMVPEQVDARKNLGAGR